MTLSLYHRPLGRDHAMEMLHHGRPEMTLTMIAQRVERFSQRNTDYVFGTIHGALYDALETCGQTYANSDAAMAAVEVLPDRTLGLIGRLANRTAWYSLRLRQLPRGGDAHTFLAHVALSPEMLTRTLMCPAFQHMRGCEEILTEPSLCALEIADALIAQYPDIARWINAAAFSGAPMDLGARRFYRVGNNDRVSIRIGDALIGRIVYQGDLDPESADLLVAGLEADPALAERFVGCAERIVHQQRRTRMSRRGLPDDAPPTPEADALRMLYQEQSLFVAAAMGEEASRANAARIQAEHEAWLTGTPR